MSDRERIEEFWKRWNHKPDESKEFVRFRTRVNNALERLWDTRFRDSELRETYCQVSGSMRFMYDREAYYRNTDLWRTLSKTDSLYDIVEQIELVFRTLVGQQYLEALCRVINSILDESPTIPIKVRYKEDRTATVYPTGSRFLDKALIEDNLGLLEKYPESAKAFETALKIYMRKQANEYRSMLDSLRVALEQMMKTVIGNDKPLEKQDVKKWIKDHDGHPQIANMYQDLLSKLTLYQNDAVKHDEDKYTLAEIEFVLYATGTFLRYIQQANEQVVA